MCQHPFSSLTISETDVAVSGAVTIKAACSGCGIKLTKSFMGRVPEQIRTVRSSKHNSHFVAISPSDFEIQNGTRHGEAVVPR